MDRKPPWLKIRPPGGETYAELKSILRSRGLHTVCEEARCPNVSECWSGGTATFMLMGDVCTRGCRFCAVKTGKRGTPLDPAEPEKIADAVAQMKLHYVVLTSVDRDDLGDGGAEHFAATIRAIKAAHPEVLVEVLTPDYLGPHLGTLLAGGPDVFAHNIEVVERLTRPFRDPRCSYRKSLDVLAGAKRLNPAQWTKSSIMLGIGESEDELVQSLRDLRAAGVDVVTLGQYLRPSPKHLPVHEYVPPERFAELRALAESLGFAYVASGPLVRSSYRAGELFLAGVLRAGKRPGELLAGLRPSPASLLADSTAHAVDMPTGSTAHAVDMPIGSTAHAVDMPTGSTAHAVETGVLGRET
ncbi:MAG: lipoyl synthase [Planctomycetes bacterium]|nr:lipoyl synthase [Planctomycetota bacterium]